MKARVDADICIGCSLCTQVCADAFRMEGDKAVAVTEEVTDSARDCCKEAAGQCPVDAIKIE